MTHGLGDVIDPTGIDLVPLLKHVFDGLSLQVVLRTTEVTGDDGIGFAFGVLNQVFLPHIGQWSDHHMLAVITQEFGRHGFHFAPKKHVQKQGFNQVILVVSQGEFVAAQFVGNPIQNAAAQS